MNQNIDSISDKTYQLEQGFVYFSKSPAHVHAVLGSCVSVCLWDKRMKYGGMNHYRHPNADNLDEATPVFGNAAMIALIRLMEDSGCRIKDIIAQIFGGGVPEDDNVSDIGSSNIEIARKILEKKGIKVVSEDVGGSLGRKIYFDTGSGKVAVLKVEKIRRTDWD